jgi:integral membrane protein
MLVRYRVMAFTTATLLIVLVFVGVPLQVAADRPGVVNVVGTLHGFLYIVYLVTAFQLTRRLGIPKWQMLLVLLAGTVPFCAFVAERKMTRRFEALVPRSHKSKPSDAGAQPAWSAAARQRWLSPRALLLHVEVLVVAPGCALAGWWQATRALSGNELSWVYSVEWPIFAVLAVLGWWHLVHEDPEAYRARRWRSREPGEHASAPSGSILPVEVEPVTGIWAAVLAAGVAVELLVGILALVLLPLGRPSGWVPERGAAVYGVHATLGLFLALGALGFLVRVRRLGRIARISSWSGAVCLALAGAGGLMTEPDSIARILGIAVMFVGTVLAGCAYLVPIVLRARAGSQTAAASGERMDLAEGHAGTSSVADGERPSAASAFPG